MTALDTLVLSQLTSGLQDVNTIRALVQTAGTNVGKFHIVASLRRLYRANLANRHDGQYQLGPVQ